MKLPNLFRFLMLALLCLWGAPSARAVELGALLEKTQAAVNAGELKSAKLPVLGKCKLLKADADTLTFEADKVEKTVAWNELATDDLAALFGELTLSFDESLALADFYYEIGLLDEAGALLGKLAQDGAQANSVQAFLAKRCGDESLAGQFELQKDLWLLPAQKEWLEGFKKTLESWSKGKGDGAAVTEAAAAQPRLAADLLLKELRAQTAAGAKLDIFSKNTAKEFKNYYDELNKRRKHALDGINDKTLYPDENHGDVAQEEIQTRAQAVRELWDTPLAYFAERHAELKAWRARLEFIAGALKQLDAYNAALHENAASEAALTALLKKQILTSKASPADAKLNEENLKLIAQYAKVPEATATAGEAELARITSEYRWMMGLNVLILSDKASQAARNHTQWMADTGIFEHEHPDEPHGEDYNTRLKNVGIVARTGSEMIAHSAKTPADALQQWTHSSGHHRLLVHVNWTHIGTGYGTGEKLKNVWTQNPYEMK